jgi:hypothetical protein
MARAVARTLALLLRDTRGATIVEFAAVAPVLLMVVLGLMGLSYNLYAATLLEGAIQEAARDSGLEGADGQTMAIDLKVRGIVDDIVSDADIEFDRRAYTDFSDVARPEDFTDTDGDGLCTGGEPFEDVNGNGTWDQDRGSEGLGGARDAVLYSVTVSYPRLFSVMKLLGFTETVSAQTRTVLRNQPYGNQDKAVTVGNCE